MSLILDALKRAERERAESSAVLADVPAGATPAAGRRWRWRLVAIAGVALVAVAVVIGLRAAKSHKPAPGVIVARSAPAPVIPPPSAAPETPSPMLPPATPAATPAPTPAPAPIPGTESVGSLDEIAEEPAPDEAPPPADAEEEAPPPEPAAQPAPRAQPTPSHPAPPQRTAPPAAASPAPATEPQVPMAAPEAERPVPQVLTQPAPMRKFREMPPEYRADFPALSIDVHVYERTPSQRFVIVNGRRYREGEQMVEGPRIVEIVKEGLVLDYRGEKVLYTLNR